MLTPTISVLCKAIKNSELQNTRVSFKWNERPSVKTKLRPTEDTFIVIIVIGVTLFKVAEHSFRAVSGIV